jgi:hypothetical protein
MFYTDWAAVEELHDYSHCLLSLVLYLARLGSCVHGRISLEPRGAEAMNYCNCPNCKTDNCPAAIELDEAEKDKKRLDWLEERWVLCGLPIMSGPEIEAQKGEIRLAIDSAMNKEKV